ncbi:MAG: energy-coupling factor transporter transrane protein EcfT [Solirubrobacterales bacterium]|nr:energy-coupling factor transporter transrane protein EcfT [Solirubrobacterales bacterium]
MIHRRVASPLHAARAGAASAYCLALAAAGMLVEHPLVLGAIAVAIVGAGAGAGVGRDLWRTARFALPLALFFALVNPFVVREGLTVFARLGEVPPFGQVDLTVEALVYGVVLGARVLVVMLGFALFSAAVDPDELLRLLRRVSMHSAMTAVLATRLMPVLSRDARRLEEARRCRADGGGSGPLARLAVLRAVSSGALDRAVDVAATLEVRGYGLPRRRGAGPRLREPWSRHDRAFAAAAAVIAGLTVWVLMTSVADFGAYPTLHLTLGLPEIVLVAAVLGAALLPFTNRQGIA